MDYKTAVERLRALLLSPHRWPRKEWERRRREFIAIVHSLESRIGALNNEVILNILGFRDWNYNTESRRAYMRLRKLCEKNPHLTFKDLTIRDRSKSVMPIIGQCYKSVLQSSRCCVKCGSKDVIEFNGWCQCLRCGESFHSKHYPEMVLITEKEEWGVEAHKTVVYFYRPVSYTHLTLPTN